ncbi:hypothetical protein CORC01_02499 [Colletotrichum orchidophilum]|uniref:Bacteriophage T5 Orf172 DNA-binding domain-containing protein n=1 Tax=Colletotrichum orchidophilum TaxID=1209926 RepID=A0A1G4BL71_9PEZI|nr:uncharacterized protein CORC01_02499 [Colletotrichum orchidophilum]OHF02219.1 hypothetical protein CORC01_02499 [Colletotrichum orchidophilum]
MHSSTPLKITKRRARAVNAAQPSTASSPLAPATRGLTPDQPVRRASFNFLSGNQVADPSWTPASGGPEESEVDTPSKKTVPRNRSTSAALSKTARSSRSEKPDDHEPPLDDPGDVARVRPSFHTSHTSPKLHSETERRGQRPIAPGRSVSEPPSTHARQLNGPQIDRNIEYLIKAGPGSKAHLPGYLYIFVTKLREGSQLLKIGITKDHPTERGKSIQNQCKHPEFFEHQGAIAPKFFLNRIAERLVHAELANFRRSWTCACEKKHKEYFDVSDEIALEVCGRWRAFCELKPWDSQGRLLPEWEHRLRHRVRFSDPRRDFDPCELARHWRTCVFPAPLEHLANDARVLWNHVFPSRWHIAAVGEALTMIFIWPTSFWTSIWWKVVLILVVLELCCLDGMYTKDSVSRLLSGSLQRFMLWKLSGESGNRPTLWAKEYLQVVSSDQQVQNEQSEDFDTDMLDEAPSYDDDGDINKDSKDCDSDSDDESMDEGVSPFQNPDKIFVGTR